MIKVTNENRAEFVSLYLEHVLNSAVLDRLVAEFDNYTRASSCRH